LVTAPVTGCVAALTDWVALVTAPVTGCVAALTDWVALVTAPVTGSVADAVPAGVPVLLDDELVGDELVGDGGFARAEDGGAETTGGEGEVAAAGRVVVDLGVVVALGVAAAAPASAFVASEPAVFETVVTAPVRLDVVGVLTPSADARLDPRNRTARTTSAPNPSRRRERSRHTKDALLSSGMGGFIRDRRRRGVVAAEVRGKSTRSVSLPRVAVVRTANRAHCDLARGTMRK
jgi:hypothetical protein